MRVLLLLALSSGVAAGAELSVNVAPAWLQLGVDRTAVIELQGPADLSEVSFTTNHGRVGPVRQLGPGRFAADYTAPGQTFPRVAIIAARGTSGGARVHGWARLPLWGSAKAEVLTAPNQTITLQIGERTFGPVKADARGRAQVALVVPPGVREARYGARALDLGLPRVALSLLVLDPPELPGDRPQAVLARLYAVAADGMPRTNLELVARAGRGTVGPFVSEDKGVYVARWEVPLGEPGDVELSAWPVTEPDALATAHLEVLPGAPATLELSVDRTEHLAGDPAELQLKAVVRDASGRLTRGRAAFSTSLGAVSAPVADEEGQWRASLRVPDSFGGAASVLVRAQLAGVPDAQVEIALKPGPPRAVRVRPEKLTLPGDGAGQAEVEVTLVDAWGNVVEGDVAVHSRAGALERLSKARFRYVAPRLRRGGETALEVGGGELHATVPIALTAVASTMTVAPKLGFLTNFGNANAPALAAELTLWPALPFGVGFEAGYFFLPREAQVGSGTLAGVRASFSLHGVPLLATAAWRTHLGRFPVGATAAGGLAVTSSVVTLADQQRVRETAVAPSLRLAASLGLPVGDGAAFLELAASWLGLPPASLVVVGPLFSLALNVGYRFELF